jgi:tetratricopeptide (TPR) repeat protein
MPTSYNGVGTHYYGRRNKKSRTAVCQHCGHKAELTSYETRLWFVFVFVPVIPLGRKRIADQCAVCERHFAIDLKQWQTGRQSETAAAIQRYRKDQSEEAALEVHGQLVAYQQYDDAAAFRSTASERFPESAQLAAGIAAHLDFIGLPGEAAELWERSFRLDPELPDARVGIASQRIRDGKPNEARELLRFLEQPGAEQQYSLEPLFDLAGHFQQDGDHEQAIEVFEVLLKAFPDLARDHQIRTFVNTSEKALERTESILPATKHSVHRLFTSQYSSNQRWTIGIAIALVLAAVGMAINNEYIRRHRTLTVINETGLAAAIQIDEQSSVPVTGMLTLAMSEGSHRVRVSGAVVEEHTLDVKAGYWERWTKNPVWIVNIGGAAIIADAKIYYAVHPREPTLQLTADPLIVKRHVDFAFETPPESVSVSSEQDIQSRTAIAWLELGSGPDAAAGGFNMLRQSDAAQAWSWAERNLLRNPDDQRLLRVLRSSAQPGEMSRLRSLLESKLDHRPVALQWHRTYQNLPEVSRDYEKTLSLYETFLRADSRNSALIYLRGRFDKNLEFGRNSVLQAIQIDADFGWPYFSRGFTRLCDAEWQSAIDDLQLAIERHVPPDDVQAYQHTAMLGIGKLTELEQQYQNSLADDPAALRTAALLAEVLVVQNRIEDAEQIVNKAVGSYKELVDEQHMDSAYGVQALMSYFKGEAEACQELAGQSEHLQPLEEMVSIESGGAAEFAARYDLNDDQMNRWLPLICSLSFHADGDIANAEIWYDRTLERLRRLGPRKETATRILSAQTISAELIEELRLVHELPMDKAAILTSVGLRADSDDLRQQFFDAAQQMMVRRRPPYLLLQRIHDAAGSTL